MRIVQFVCACLISFLFGIALCFVLMTEKHQKQKDILSADLAKINSQLVEAKTELRVLEDQGVIKHSLPPPPPFEGDLKEVPYEENRLAN